MNPTVTRTLRKTLVGALALVLVSLLTAATPSLAENNCGAEITSPQQGQTTLNTQVISTSVDTGTTFQGVIVSTTGDIQVEIDHTCIFNLILHVFKVDADGTQQMIHEAQWRFGDEPCVGDKFVQTEVEDVTIGLDAGEYVFEIGWMDCNGREGGDLEDGTVFDPPLPLPETQTVTRRL